MTSARTYYVRSDGSDSNTGLADNAGGAFLTIQKAVDVVSGTLDMSTYQVTIQVRTGTYAPVSLKTCVGVLPPILNGDTSTPSNCLITASSGTGALVYDGINSNAKGTWRVSGFKFTTTGTASYGIYVSDYCRVRMSFCDFGANVVAQIAAQNYGGIALMGNYSITASSPVHVYSDVGGNIVSFGITVTLTGTPAFSNAYAIATTIGVIKLQSITFSGSATGIRYTANSNGVIQTVGGGATYLPGN